MELTALSKNAINNAIRIIKECEEKVKFSDFYKKPGRKVLNKENPHNRIRMVKGEDNSLTQYGCAELIEGIFQNLKFLENLRKLD